MGSSVELVVFNHLKELAQPPEAEVGPSVTCVSTKESCVDPSG